MTTLEYIETILHPVVKERARRAYDPKFWPYEVEDFPDAISSIYLYEKTKEGPMYWGMVENGEYDRAELWLKANRPDVFKEVVVPQEKLPQLEDLLEEMAEALNRADKSITVAIRAGLEGFSSEDVEDAINKNYTTQTIRQALAKYEQFKNK